MSFLCRVSEFILRDRVRRSDTSECCSFTLKVARWGASASNQGTREGQGKRVQLDRDHEAEPEMMPDGLYMPSGPQTSRDPPGSTGGCGWGEEHLDYIAYLAASQMDRIFAEYDIVLDALGLNNGVLTLQNRPFPLQRECSDHDENGSRYQLYQILHPSPTSAFPVFAEHWGRMVISGPACLSRILQSLLQPG